MRPITVLSLSLFFGTVVILPAAPEPELTTADLPRRPATPPTKSLATFQIRPGFKAQLVAAEPLVVDPVAMAFNEAGQLFVVEMRDYSERQAERLGRVRMLEDTNGDGIFDRSTVYVDNLPWPTGVACFDGGVFVASTPDILFCKDRDGDGVADERKVIFSGFGEGVERLNVQQLLNSLTWSLDNRIHGASGGNSGVIRVPSHPEMMAVPLRGRDFSFNPRTLEFRAESGGGQYGLSFDNRGRKYICSNSSHIRTVMYEDRYAGGDGLYPLPPAAIDIPVDGPAAPVFRISPDEPWRVIRTRWRVEGTVPGLIEGGGKPSGYFTGATGITIYRGDAWPSEFFGDAFIADCGSNLIHRKKIGGAAGLLKAARAADEQQSEFLASTDNWFRPVQFANAPDGALYFADMYREVIEHPWSLPPAIKKHLDLNSGNDRGRIYRIVPEKFTHRSISNLARASTADIVSLLEHRNGWHRDTAARLLFERQPAGAAESVRHILQNSTSALGRMHALYALSGLGSLREGDIAQALSDAAAEVRQHALRLGEPWLNSPEIKDQLAAITRDVDPEVRLQLAYSLGSAPSPVAETVADLLRETADSWQMHAALNAARREPSKVLALVLRQPRLDRNVVYSLAVMIGARNDTSGTDRTIDELSRLHQQRLSARAPEPVVLAAITGLIDGTQRAGRSVTAIAADPRLKGVHEFALLEAKAGSGPSSLDAVRALGAFGTKGDLDLLEELVRIATTQTLREAALIGLARHHEVSRVIRHWDAITPRLRADAIQQFLSRTNTARQLMEAVTQGSIARSDFSAAQTQGLLSSSDPEIRKEAARLFARPAKPQKAAQLAAEVMPLKGNAEEGRKIYLERCASCHRLANQGFAAGPDLESVRTSGREALLMNLLDPNREIAPKYLRYLVAMKNGEEWTGMVASESDATITLHNGNGFEKVLDRRDIQKFTSSGESLMPEGLAEGLRAQDLANLAEFILAPLR